MTITLILPEGGKMQYYTGSGPQSFARGNERIDIFELAQFEFTPRKKVGVRYYNTVSTQLLEFKVEGQQNDHIQVDVAQKLINKQRTLEDEHQFFTRLLGLVNKEVISPKESDKITKLYRGDSQEDRNLAIGLVQKQFEKLNEEGL